MSDEVKDALYSKKPIVALETTIYTHGFPYPDNVALALDLESIVRRNGAVPATIGVLDGVARVGMTTEELRMITASAGSPGTMKVSRRDLPYILGLVSFLTAARIFNPLESNTKSVFRDMLTVN
jgi:pseudouridine-5'-phosphate glycosidase/pseudouridine kinase